MQREQTVPVPICIVSTVLKQTVQTSSWLPQCQRTGPAHAAVGSWAVSMTHVSMGPVMFTALIPKAKALYAG